MNYFIKMITVFATIIAITSMLGGCGEKDETNVPAVKLTASAIVSELASGHGHNVEIPFSDIDLASNPG